MRVKSRRKAREAALRALYEYSLTDTHVFNITHNVFEEMELAPDLASFGEKLVRGVIDNIDEVDSKIESALIDWTMDRLAVVDRTVMRIATFELLHLPSTPPAVTINEAIEIVKRYSTAESGKLVNGVLAKILSESPKANWDPSLATDEFEDEDLEMPEPIEVVEETIEADSAEAKRLSKLGGWTIRTGD